MQLAEVDRGDFIELAGGKRSFADFRNRWGYAPKEPRPGNFLVAYPSEPDAITRIPPLLITSSGGSRDAIAWLSTYIGEFQPISAFCRVLEWHEWMVISNLHEQPKPLVPTESIVSAMILAEAMTHSREVGSATELTPLACQSTYSFARARFTNIYSVPESGNAGDLPFRWTSVRNLLGSTPLSVSAEQVETVWSVWSRARLRSYSNTDESVLIDAVQQLMEDGIVSSGTISRLADAETASLLDGGELRASRDRRYNVFSELVERSVARANNVRRRTETAFVLAYTASRMAPGTFEYARAVAEQLNLFPEVLLWYGLCEGSIRESRVHSEFGGLGARVFRDVIVQRDIASRPTCDVALLELLAILEAKVFKRSRLSRQSNLTVEIFPLVDAVCRVGQHSEQQVNQTQQRALGFPEDALPDAIEAALKVLRNTIQATFKTDEAKQRSAAKSKRNTKRPGKK